MASTAQTPPTGRPDATHQSSRHWAGVAEVAAGATCVATARPAGFEDAPWDMPATAPTAVTTVTVSAPASAKAWRRLLIDGSLFVLMTLQL